MGIEQSKLQPDILEDIHRQTHFTKDEIQEKYKNFLEDYPSGFVQLEEFKSVYRDIVRRGDPSKFAEYVFNGFDTNGDGKLDFREFIMGLYIVDRGTKDEKLRLAFKIHDLDGNGYITCDEMRKVMKSLYDICVTSLPHNKSIVKKHSAKQFKMLDKKLDGKVTYEEFQQMVSWCPSLLELFNLCTPAPNAY